MFNLVSSLYQLTYSTVRILSARAPTVTSDEIRPTPRRHVIIEWILPVVPNLLSLGYL